MKPSAAALFTMLMASAERLRDGFLDPLPPGQARAAPSPSKKPDGLRLSQAFAPVGNRLAHDPAPLTQRDGAWRLSSSCSFLAMASAPRLWPNSRRLSIISTAR